MDKEALRTQGMESSDFFTSKSRFGLFSHPVSTAVGDNGPYLTNLHPRQNDGKGKPVTNPKNVQSGTYRTGKIKEPYFRSLNPLTASNIKDQYIEEGKRLIREDNQQYEKGNKNEASFIPASGTGNSILYKAAYEYMEEKKPLPNPKRNRQEDGRVKTQMANIFTNTNKKIQNQYFKNQKYISDPYDREHKLKLQKQRKDKSLEGENTFKPNCFASKQFSKNISVYGLDRQIKKKTVKVDKVSKTIHEEAWKSSNPSKKGVYGYFNPFPQYKQNPPKEVKKKNEEEKKQAFKSMSSKLTKPCPSISLNELNIRKNISNSLKLR